MAFEVAVIARLSRSAMGGFGLGLVLATLVLVSSGGVITSASIMTHPLVIVFTMLGLGMGFEQ